MALRDYEERQLAEIDRQLTEESPRLARRFVHFRLISTLSLIIVTDGSLALVTTGLAMVSIAVQRGLAGPFIIGAAITTLTPIGIGWYLSRDP